MGGVIIFFSLEEQMRHLMLKYFRHHINVNNTIIMPCIYRVGIK